MTDVKQSSDVVQNAPGEKETTKPPSPKPDQEESQEVSPPLISTSKADSKDDGKESKGKSLPQKTERRQSMAPKQGQAKKGVVLSGEAMKEMQKQLKATKDERRMKMDARHSFLVGKLADALGMEPSTVEDYLLGDERFDMIGEFFEAHKSRKLMFFYQEPVRDSMYSRTDASSVVQQSNVPKKLFITTGAAESLTGVCFYFLRPNNEKAVTNNNIATEVTFGMLDCNGGKLLEGFESMMSKIMMPALRSQESWGKELDGNNGRVSDFLESLEKFVNSLVGARDNMEGHITLADSEHGHLLNGLKTPTDYQTTANNSDLLEKLEELLHAWCKQIEQVLAESEQIRREADDIGPTAELAYWKARMAKFNTLLEQVKSPRCRAVVGVLNCAKSKSLRKWVALDAKITDAANEAKDNVKYLYTLDKFFGPLVKCTPADMVDHIPSLMNAIRMIYSISTYYNTTERMTSLFVKVTNQMISTCKAYIKCGVSKVWDHTRDELLQRIKECMALNAEYQKQFHKTQLTLRETPSERQFDFSENYIFGKFDAFGKCLGKIIDMITTMDAYSGLGDVRIEGIDVIAVRYKTLVDATKKKKVPTATLR